MITSIVTEPRGNHTHVIIRWKGATIGTLILPHEAVAELIERLSELDVTLRQVSDSIRYGKARHEIVFCRVCGCDNWNDANPQCRSCGVTITYGP